MEHTPTPWVLHLGWADWGLGAAHEIRTSDKDHARTIALVEFQQPYCMGEKQSVEDACATALADANFIVEAVNAHAKLTADRDELLKALKLARDNLQFLPPNYVVEKIDAAIAQAKEQS